MTNQGALIRIWSFLLMIGIIIWVFVLMVWRGWVVFGIEQDKKRIVLIALGLIATLIASMMINSLPWKGTEIMGTILLWWIYIFRVIAPLIIIADLIGIWYKIPPLRIMGACLLRVACGVYFGTHTKVTPLDISSPHIQQEHKIIFISDLHVELIHNSAFIQSIVKQIKHINPDFVIIGGDLMNNAKAEYLSAFLPFNQLSMPIYATLGNHDHMGNAWAIDQIFTTTKILPLRNQSINLGDIQLVGIDDKSYRSGQSLTGILDASHIQNQGQYTILVTHEPQKLKKLDGYPIDLELAGHTHNGQFIPLSWLMPLFNDYAYGRYDEGAKSAFVSQGVGTRWAPIRIGTQSEMVLITLHKE